MGPVTSYGLVLLAEPGLIFLAHATGTGHWDVPKGGAEAGESPLQAVQREVYEETGLRLSATPLKDLGVQRYRADKQLHLFAARVAPDAVQPSLCRCTSLFAHRVSGRMLPEVDQYAWVAFSDVPARCGKNLSRVLCQALTLPTLLASLPVVQFPQG